MNIISYLKRILHRPSALELATSEFSEVQREVLQWARYVEDSMAGLEVRNRRLKRLEKAISSLSNSLK